MISANSKNFTQTVNLKNAGSIPALPTNAEIV